MAEWREARHRFGGVTLMPNRYFDSVMRGVSSASKPWPEGSGFSRDDILRVSAVASAVIKSSGIGMPMLICSDDAEGAVCFHWRGERFVMMYVGRALDATVFTQAEEAEYQLSTKAGQRLAVGQFKRAKRGRA